MALSQIQCLDDNHVNPRTHESKPEFLYSENQRLALEALLRDGREAFIKFLEDRGLRGFLSDLEQEALSGAVEPYDPGLELFSENDEEDTSPLSLHYWPDLSDTSIPQLDLGWPDCEAYRGVTRTTVHTQPPLDGQAHIKEVVRKMIAQAQKVIAVVMDIFTDVDIFRDLLDAGFKRKVSVYILLERTTLPHFLSMCQRANMHAGHLKHLRVRCTGGTEFYTRFSTRVRGQMGHRFMFIDGDKAVSGSYSFTWTSSRLDRNLITVVTGQAVGGFDHLFRILYSSSTSVDFQEVTMDPEPEPDPLPQQTALTPPSAAVARKMYSAKYALVALSNPSPTTSVGCDTPKEPEISEKPKKKRRRRASKEDVQEGPPLHPGLVDLEKAYLMDYLPTWPEPDPPSDVIGFINIRDAKKPTQVHLQRSEMFETSQAIRFSSPFSQPKEILPEVAKPRQLTVNHWDVNKYQPALNKTNAKELTVDKAQPAQVSVARADIKNKENTPGQKSPASGQKSEPDKNTSKINTAENKLSSNTATNYKAGNTPPPLSAHTLTQSSSKAFTPNRDNDSHTTQTISANSPKTDSCLESKKAVETLTGLNPRRAVVYRTHTVELNSTQSSQLPDPTDSKSSTEQDTREKTVLSATHSHTQEVHKKPEISSKMTPNSPNGRNHISTSSASAMVPTFLSDKNHIGITTAHSTTTTTSACVSVPSTSISSSLFNSSNTTLNPPLPSSSSPESSAPPVPKRRTCQLVIKDSSISNDEKLPTISVVKRLEIIGGRLVADSEPGVAVPAKEPETVPEVQDNSASKTGAQKDTKDTGHPKEASPQKQSVTSHETKGKVADEQHGRPGEQSVPEAKLQTQSDVLITDAPKKTSGDTRKVTPKDVGPKTLSSGNSKITPKTETDGVATSPTDTPEKKQTKDENVTPRKQYLAKAHEPQRISYYKLTPEDIGLLDDVDSIKAPIRTSVSTSHHSHVSKDSAADSTRTSAADTHGQQGKLPRFPAAHPADSPLNTAKHNSTFQEQIPKSRGGAQTMHLHLSDSHVPDLRSPTTPERESRLLTALARTPTPDGFLPRTPTSDSRATTPDPRSYTPDFRTPTPDGYVSAVSTTSEEYFECSDSPLNDPVFDHVGFLNHGLMEDHVGFTLTSSPKATSPGTSPGLVNYTPGASQLGTASRNTSSSELQKLSGPAGVSSSSSSSSSSLGKKVKMREGELTANEEKKQRKEEDGKGRKVSVAERESPKTERQDNVPETKTVDHFKPTTETAEKKEPQTPKRKRVVNQSAADKLTDGGVTAGSHLSTNEGTESKRWSTSDLKPETLAERPDKGFSWREKALNRALRPSGAEKRDNLQSTREAEIQKLLQSPSKAQRVPQQDPGALPPSRPPRASRPLSAAQPLAPRPWTNRQLSQTDSKVLHGSLQVLDNMSSARKPPPRPPPPAAVGPVGAAAGRKQISQTSQSLLSRQIPAAQSRARAGQMQTPHAKTQASFLHSAQQPELHSHPQNHMVSEQDAHGSDEGRAPFAFTFSRLYSLRGLKDRMSKVPAQSKRGSASPPVHKSTN